MDTIVSYAERAFDPLSVESFTPVDSLIFSWFTHFEISSCVPEVCSPSGAPIRDLLLAEHFGSYFPSLWDPDKSRQLLVALAASPRFREVRVSRCVEQIEDAEQLQFAACTFLIGDDLACIAFRGTDRTLVGWKEDFNMAFQCPVPAQVAAARYVREFAAASHRQILIGGHSKGGNLAIYAAAANQREAGDRLVRVYSHDGPGFLTEYSTSDDLVAIADRIDKTVPQSSIVGMLLDQSNDVRIIKSTRIGLWQHDPFSWEVEDDDFALVNELTADARHIDNTLSAWLAEHSQVERERFVNTIYSLITLPGVRTIDDLIEQWPALLSAIGSEIAALDPDTKTFMWDMLRGLAEAGFQQLSTTIKELRSPKEGAQ